MSKPTPDNLARDLVRLLSDMTGMYGEIAMHMHDKIEAIKKADTDRMTSITAREMVLTDRLTERQGLRRQLMRLLQQGLGLGTAPMRVAALAEHLPEPRRSQLLTVSAGLKQQLASMEQLRLTSTMVAQQMLKHLDEVLSVMTAGAPGSDLYGRGGVRQKSGAAHVFEAVG
jgi:hypothetical protein